MTDFAHVMAPIRIGQVELPNRVVRTAHVTMLGRDDPSGISDRLIAYHAARARGGVGMSILEICSGHSSSPATLNAFNPALLAGYRRLVDAIRPLGMRLFQQIWHGGHHAAPLDGSAPWSASDIPSPRIGVVPQPMTRAMIDAAIEGYVLAARTAVAGGIDGIEVHGSHGYLIQQFLSPITNRREDDYGGSTERRRRFLVEVLRAVRSEVGPGVPVGVRLGPDYVAGGFGVADSIELVGYLEVAGLVDFIDISQGSYSAMAKIIGAMHEPVGYQLDDSIPIAAAATVPTIVTGRFRTLEEADQVVRLGQADCVSMVRATIAEPDLVAKSLAGRMLEARPCIACNQGCIGAQISGKGALGCTVNPAVGFEAERDDMIVGRAPVRRRIVVVGGGPAGMEAARVAAARGHEVILFEADRMLGGKLRLAARAPFRASIGDIATWLEAELYRLGVDMRLNSYVDADDVAAMKPDAVIYAAGAMPRDDGFRWSDPSHALQTGNASPILTSFDVLAPGTDPGDGPFVIEDDVGHYEGIALADFLLARGAEVTYVTRHVSLAPLMESALSAQPAADRLFAHPRFQLHTRAAVASRGSDHVELTLPGNRHLEVAAKAVVAVSYPALDTGFAARAVELDLRVHAIGDAKTPRFLEAAMNDGRVTALAL